MADKWYDDATLLRNFTAAMIEAGVEDSQDILRKPHKYNDEFEAWVDNGYPDEEGDEGWDEFVSAITSEEEGE